MAYRLPRNMSLALLQLCGIVREVYRLLRIRPLGFGNEVVGGKGVIRVKSWAIEVVECESLLVSSPKTILIREFSLFLLDQSSSAMSANGYGSGSTWISCAMSYTRKSL